MPQQRFATLNVATEWSYQSAKSYADPFNEIEIDVVFRDPAGRERRVPAFWSGGGEWRVRFAPGSLGDYNFRTVCSDESSDLHGQEGALHVEPYEGDNPLLQHGPLRVSEDRRRLEHADGTPFFWLGDTWWLAVTKRLKWPDDFQRLTADRTAKGFSVIQLVAGLFPDMPAFDERGANEAGQAWERNWARINPRYYDVADLKIQWLVRSCLVPCIVGCWGYYLPMLGVDKMKKHWRHLIARYGAYPVVWCLAGEGSMPWYLSRQKEKDEALQKDGWAEVGRYVQETDPYDHPVTIHPSSSARDTVADDSVLDFDMLQTGHSGAASIPNTIETLRRELVRQPPMPVINGEVCYEGILENSWQDIQRFMFWSCMLDGAAGHTYGANGIWQFNDRDEPYGPSPWGGAWGNRPWQDAYRLPGSGQVGVARGILERFDWHRFEPHREWVEPSGGKDDYLAPYAAGIPREVRVIYLPKPYFPWDSKNPIVRKLEADVTYQALFVDPKNGTNIAIGLVEPDDGGNWPVPLAPAMQDWVLVLEKAKVDVTPPGAVMYA